MTSAQISCSEMTFLMEKMPEYSHYRSTKEASQAEKLYRRALGLMLKECGDHLLTVVEKKSQLLETQQEHLIDALIDRIGLIFRRLDREGNVCLVGHCSSTIAELEELDTRLLLLIEESMALVRGLGSDIPASSWFKNEAQRLHRDLADFGEMTEERNYLLGLGWESEFTYGGSA
ncbi:MAG: hypothetical protein GY780_03405 [bacterium]|nr:hypothetical protein [bacterium]